MENEIDITVVIVSYNTANVITDTIESVLKQKNIKFELIIIDNHSPDHSVDILKKYADRLTLVLNATNVGSGQGANQGFKLASGRFLYLLNPDAVLSTETALYDICQYMERNPRIGLAGTRVLEQNGRLDVAPRTSYPYQQYTLKFYLELPGKIAWVLGASLVLTKPVFALTGGFAKEFFLYGDEVDLCLRTRKAGYEIGYIDNVVVKHIGKSSEYNTRVYDYWIKKQNGLHNFIQKHYSKEEVIKVLTLEKNRAWWRSRAWQVKHVFKLNKKSRQKIDQYTAIFDSSDKLLKKIMLMD